MPGVMEGISIPVAIIRVEHTVSCVKRFRCCAALFLIGLCSTLWAPVAQSQLPSQSDNPLCAIMPEVGDASVQTQWELPPRGWWCAIWWTVDGRRVTAGIMVPNSGGEQTDLEAFRKETESSWSWRQARIVPTTDFGNGEGSAYEIFARAEDTDCSNCYVTHFKTGCVDVWLRALPGSPGREIAIQIDQRLKAHSTRGCNLQRQAAGSGGTESTGPSEGGGNPETGTGSGSDIPGPTVIGGTGPSTGDVPPAPPEDSGGSKLPLIALLAGAVLVGAATLGKWNASRGGTRTLPAARETANAASRPLEFPEPIEELPETPEDSGDGLSFGPPDTLPEPIAPAGDDPIARLKAKGKKAIDAAKASMPKEKQDRPKKEIEIGEIDSPELSKLKKELKEWEDAKKTSESKTSESKPSRGDKTELEKLKEEKKRAEEAADKKILDEIDNDLREIEERQKREEEETKRWMEAEEKRLLERQQAEKERQEKEAEEKRKEAERAAAEEAELKRQREERERARREEEAKQEAEDAAREAAEAEAARKAAEAEAAKAAEEEAAKKKAAEKKESEAEKREREIREIDDFYRQEAIEKAREADAKDRKRLEELGFTPRDIAEYRRNLGMMEAGTYERSGDRMGLVERGAEWVSYVGDKSVDLLSSLTGTAGSRVKDLYVGGKYFLGSAVGDLLPGGEGVTTQRVAKGASDAVIEVGMSKAWDKVLETGGLKWSKMPEGYDISNATSYWPQAFGAGRSWANNIRANAYVQAVKGLVEGTVWDITTVDRWKNLLKGDPIETAANAFEKYVLGFPSN